MFYFYIVLAIIGVIVVIGIPLGVLGDKLRNREIEEVFGGRESLDEKDFYEKYFEERGVPFFIVKEIREILEEVLDADLSRLSAEDDFSKNLNFFWQHDSLADVEMFEKIEEEFEIKLHQSDFDNLKTTSVNDIVNIVWRKV
jgi:acyl carrier protein